MVVTFDLLGKAGQLGNQMFQYALLIGLKYKINADIIIDNSVTHSSYLFDFFELKECKIENFQTDIIYQENQFHFDPKVFEIISDTNFRGYFQSEKYFSHCKDIIKQEFKFKENISEKVDVYLQDFYGKKLVSVHVRRGDYLSNPDAHPLCSIEYYNNAMSLLDDENTLFICTSDDIEWCKENLQRKNIVFTNNHLAHDMCLISKCHHHIIANSTFSWWGAWLSENKDKKIISPKIWFGSRYSHFDLSDLYCDNFIKI